MQAVAQARSVISWSPGQLGSRLRHLSDTMPLRTNIPTLGGGPRFARYAAHEAMVGARIAWREFRRG